MADAVLVGLLLVFILTAVLVPPAAGARASREAEFLGSIRPGSHPLDSRRPAGWQSLELDAVDQPRFRPALTANARRRQVLGGLVVAMGATLLLGLLPTFRLLLVVHLLLVNSCLAYVGLLVHMRDQSAARGRAAAPVGWRDGSRRVALDDESTFAHPYAATDADDLWYQGDLASSYDGYADDPAYADTAYADTAYDDPAYADTTYYAGDGEEWPDDAAEAAYVDDELGLAQPA